MSSHSHPVQRCLTPFCRLTLTLFSAASRPSVVSLTPHSFFSPWHRRRDSDANHPTAATTAATTRRPPTPAPVPLP